MCRPIEKQILTSRWFEFRGMIVIMTHLGLNP